MWTAETLALVGGTFLLAGLVKGVIGLGVPTVSLALLTATLGLQPAMALLLFPAFITNLWQGLVGGHLRVLLRRTWSLLLMVCLGTWLGVALLARLDTALLAALLGLLLCLYSALSLTRPQVPPPGRHEGWLSPAVGAVNGVLTGMTGSFVVPGVLYLQALGLARDALIQAMGLLFTVSTLALGLALGERDFLSGDLALLSAAAVAPALVGMLLGQQVRRRLSEPAFRKLFFVALFLLGAYIVAGAVG